jgi:hypothetical protein
MLLLGPFNNKEQNLDRLHSTTIHAVVVAASMVLPARGDGSSSGCLPDVRWAGLFF